MKTITKSTRYVGHCKVGKWNYNGNPDSMVIGLKLCSPVTTTMFHSPLQLLLVTVVLCSIVHSKSHYLAFSELKLLIIHFYILLVQMYSFLTFLTHEVREVGLNLKT
jgi:hypothetical protein